MAERRYPSSELELIEALLPYTTHIHTCGTRFGGDCESYHKPRCELDRLRRIGVKMLADNESESLLRRKPMSEPTPQKGSYQPSELEAAAFPYLSQTCWCGRCDTEAITLLPEGDIRRICRRMNLCPSCGNKRCPRSWDHIYACTGSNEPDQRPTVANGGSKP